MVSSFGQLKMSRRQTGDGVGADSVILRTIGKIFPIARRENFHFAVHNFVGDAAGIFDFENLSFARKRKSQRYDCQRENRETDEQVHFQKTAFGMKVFVKWL